MMHVKCVVPFLIEVFADETAVAVMRFVLREKEACPIKHFRVEARIDFSFRHQSEIVLLVSTPVNFLFLVCLTHWIGRCQHGLVHVLNTADFLEKIRKIAGYFV